MERLIKRRRKPFYYFFNTVAKRVACIIAALIIAVAGAVLNVDALRVGVKNFFVEAYEKFSTVFFQKDSSAPDTIEVYYAPSYIPDGYETCRIKKENWLYSVEYKNKNYEVIYYEQTIISGRVNIDTEGEKSEEIGNGLYVYQSKLKQQMYFWSNGKYEFALYAYDDISKEELLKVADSLKAEK